MCRPRGPRGSRSGTSEGSLPVHVLSVTQSPSGGRRAAARSHAHPKCKTRPHIPGRPKGTGRGEKRPPPAPTPALPSRSFQSVGGLYGVGHTRPAAPADAIRLYRARRLAGSHGSSPGAGGRWHSARDGPEGWARVGVSGEAQGEPGRRGQRVWKPRR